MEELMLTSGASAGLSMALSILTDPSKCIGKFLFLSPMHLLHWYLSELIYKNLFLILYWLQFDKKMIQQ